MLENETVMGVWLLVMVSSRVAEGEWEYQQNWMDDGKNTELL